MDKYKIESISLEEYNSYPMISRLNEPDGEEIFYYKVYNSGFAVVYSDPFEEIDTGFAPHFIESFECVTNLGRFNI